METATAPTEYVEVTKDDPYCMTSQSRLPNGTWTTSYFAPAKGFGPTGSMKFTIETCDKRGWNQLDTKYHRG